jgi:hypothetical protein
VDLHWYAELAKPFLIDGTCNCSASLVTIVVTTAYFVKASVMHKMNFLVLSAVSMD